MALECDVKHPQRQGKPRSECEHAQGSHGGLRWFTSLVVACLLAFSASVPTQDGRTHELTSHCLSAHQPDSEPSSESNPQQPKPTLSVPAGIRSKHVVVIPIGREVDAITASSVLRRIKVAEQAGADAIVIELDCPGGEVGAVLEITSAIKSTTVPMTVAWIHPMAYSGGAIIALSCDHIVTADPSAMGDAFPIILGFEGVQQVPEELRVKVFPPLIAEVVDSARRNGYDEYLSQAIVMNGVELWQVEHTETGRRICIDRDEYRTLFDAEPTIGKPRIQTGTGRTPRSAAPRNPPSDGGGESAPDQRAPSTDAPSAPKQALPDDGDEFKPAFDADPELQRLISAGLRERSRRPTITAADKGNWKLVEFVCDGTAPVVMGPDDMIDLGFAVDGVSSDEELTQFFGAERVDRLEPELTESLAAFVSILAHPLIRAMLIAVCLICLMLELSAPGLGIPGLVAVAAGTAVVLPAVLIGIASWWEIAAMGLGMLLIAVELFVIPGFGVPGIAGILLLFGGLVGTFVGPGSGLVPQSSAQQTDLLYGFVSVMLAVSVASVGFYFITKNTERLPMFQKLVLASTVKSPIDNENATDPLLDVMRKVHSSSPTVGLVGTVVSPLRPYGKADFAGTIIEVVAATGAADPGDSIRVIAVRGARVEVEPIDGTAT